MVAKWGGKINFDKIKKAIRNDVILLGYPEGNPHNSGKLDLDEIAEINSESKTHPRPFLKDGIKANLTEIDKAIKQEYVGRIQGKNSNLDKIAIIAQVGIQEFVKGEYYKEHMPNALSTIKGKTSKAGKKSGELKDKPLINTAQTINGLTYKVEKI
jgi:hypothetical protein